MDLISWWWNPLEAIFGVWSAWIVVFAVGFTWGWLVDVAKDDRTPEQRRKDNREWKQKRDRMRDIERGRMFGDWEAQMRRQQDRRREQAGQKSREWIEKEQAERRRRSE